MDALLGLLLLLNAYRAEHGSEALERSPTLDLIAEQRCMRQQEQGFLSHSGLPPGVGENLASGFEDEETVMAAWQQSGGHDDNMRLRYFVEVGLARCDSYWVQIFGLGEQPPTPQVWLIEVAVG